NGSSGNVTLTQGDNTSSTPVTVDGGIVVSDLDNGTLASATVAISNFQDGGDVLLFIGNPSTMGNINGSYSNGVLTLSSAGNSATVAQWQAALRSIQFQNFSSVPTTTPRVVTFVISDGTKTSGTWSRTVDVALTDQTPLLDTSGGTTTFTSADNAPSTPVAIDAGLILTDSDSATMASATVQITGNYVAGEDVLALGGSFGDITANFDANSGKLTLSSAGASTNAQWIAALRSVTYTDLAAVPTGTTRTISFAVSDGTKTSATETKSLGIVATHQTPVLTSGASTSQNFLPGNPATTIDSGLTLTDLNVGNPSALVSLTITVQITSGFESGDVLSFSGLGQIPVNGISPSYDPSTGTLTITSTGGTLSQWQSVLDNLQFQTGSGAPLGTRAISISIGDGVKTSAPATYSIDVISSAPSLATSSTGSASFQAGDNTPATPIAIDAGMTVGDPLGNVVDTAVIAITGNLHSGEDVLGFVNNGLTMGDITGTYNPLTGVLVLSSSSGTATLAQWQSALDSVTYTDTAITPNTATRTVSITLSAGAQTSNTLTRTITVAAADQTPILSTGSTGSVPFTAGDNA
ncbi:beta strand repeat-containing protein, partial [Burkholderia gladioli]